MFSMPYAAFFPRIIRRVSCCWSFFGRQPTYGIRWPLTLTHRFIGRPRLILNRLSCYIGDLKVLTILA
jgi:hypothetical protein